MQEYILTACDGHDKNLVLRIARGMEAPQQRTFHNDPEGRSRMIAELSKRSTQAGGAQVVFAYEASGLGFGLYDELTAAGFRCYVLAPTRIARSSKHRKGKNDQRDAQQILELLRAHVLAGNPLPAVWIPDRRLRDDRELLRARLDAGDKAARLKNQVQALLKRHEVRRPAEAGESWSSGHRRWLKQLAERKGSASALGPGALIALKSLLAQIEAIEEQIQELDEQVKTLARTARYARPVKALDELAGVGVLTAMVYLTEMGDLSRFSNRRQVAAYLGLVPSSDESGDQADRKGHITRQGSGRVRKVLCQALWAALRSDPKVQAAHARLVKRNPKHKKIAVVAGMRRLAIVMWHKAKAAMPPPAPRKAPKRKVA
jgi:transposase